MAENNQADILSQLSDITNSIAEGVVDNKNDYSKNVQLLASIDQTLKQIAQNGGNMSAANARNAMGGYGDIRSIFRDRNAARGIGGSRSGGGFVDGLEDALLESVLGSDYRNRIKGVMNQFADDLGVSLKDVPQTLGKEVGKRLIDSIKNTDAGKDLFDRVGDFRDKSWDKVRSAYSRGKAEYTQTQNGQSVSKTAANKAGEVAKQGLESIAKDQIQNMMAEEVLAGTTESLAAVGTETASVGAAMGGLEAAMAAFQPEILIVMAAMVALEVVTEKLKEAFKPAIDGLKALGEASKAAWNRENASREKYAQLAADRLKADIETMIKTPFDILTDAANRVYQAWDDTIGIINQTQGYTKADLQSLLGAFASRLRDEGLESVIASTDVITALENTLKQGLSGKLAEEFAYQAAKLNAEIPTQDFFNYAATYSSIAANAIKEGKSQAEAISLANTQLEAFASNVLYASRQLTGGFSTGLQNAQDLFDKSVRIAQAAKTGESSQISGVLSSVSAIVGAIAPDLASSVVDTVYQAAVGGNKNSSLVALRSLAGINASNTEFLRQLATNPQQVFSALFNKLSQMQNMSDAYMETSEGLAELFGMSVDAFARVDFNYLANAISQMNVNSATLAENQALLASGESTTSKEEMRIQQINKYLIDEGLSYVMDNEAARLIQQHMWDEQIAQQIMEAEYAVNLQGAALQALQGIAHTVDNILSFINPLAWGKRIANLVATAVEVEAEDTDIRRLLEAGKVGNGNATSFYQLTTRGKELNLTQSLVEMFGGKSVYASAESTRKKIQNAMNFLTTPLQWGNINISKNVASGYTPMGVSSKYAWGGMGKAEAAEFAAGTRGTAYVAQQATRTASQARVNANLQKLMATLTDYVDPEKGAKRNAAGYFYSYEDWAANASKYGITDLGKALEQEGYTEQQIKEYFQDAVTRSGAEEELRRREIEEEAWNTTIKELPIIDANGVETNRLLGITNEWLNKLWDDTQQMRKDLGTYLKNWMYYVYEHKVYDAAYSASDVKKLQTQFKASEQDDAIMQLANILTKNTNDLTDPQVQGNALLAEILKTVLVIMNQNNNKVSTDQLKDSMNALALGMSS